MFATNTCKTKSFLKENNNFFLNGRIKKGSVFFLLSPLCRIMSNGMLLMLEVHVILYQQNSLKRLVCHLRKIAQQIT